MNFTFENQGTNTYLVYTVQPDDNLDTMSLGMLTNNKILGLAPTQFMQMDTTKYIKYNISAHISVKQFFSGVVNKKRLLGVFKGIVNAMLSAEDYMIDTNSIIMDLNYIYADVSTCETVLICLPVSSVVQAPIDLNSFFKEIVFTTQFDQTENCDHVAKIINYLNGTPMFSLTDFKNLLDEISSSVQPVQVKVNPVPTQTPAPIQSVPIQSAPVQATPVQVPPVNTAPKQSAPIQGQYVLPAQKPAPVQKPPVTNKQPLPPKQVNVQTPVPPKNSAVNNSQAPAGGEKMSFFYLMQHYNKENAAAYKAQKNAKKSGAVPQKPVNGVPYKSTPVAPQNNMGFAIPGQPSPTPVQKPAIPVPTQSKPVQPVVSPTPNAQSMNAVPQPMSPVSQPAYVPREVPQGGAMNFGETTVLGGGAIGETTVLTAAQGPTQSVTPHLIRMKNNEKTSVNKPVYRIGKERSYVDYFIGDNTAISRSHANIICKDKEYFVMDTNSTNHTYVNGSMIQSNAEVQIKHGDVIKFANEEFEFKLY